MPNSANNGINPTSLFKIGDTVRITKDQPLGAPILAGQIYYIKDIYLCCVTSPDCTDGCSYELDSGWLVYAGHIELTSVNAVVGTTSSYTTPATFQVGDDVTITKNYPRGTPIRAGDIDYIESISMTFVQGDPDCRDGRVYTLGRSRCFLYAGHMRLYMPSLTTAPGSSVLARAHINQYSSSIGQPTVPVTDDNKKAEWKKYCAHEMVEYVGMTERYKFCKKCDYKEEYT